MRPPSAIFRALLSGCLVWAGVSAWAQNSIVSVTGSAQGDVETVRIEFAQPLAALPAAFVTQSPARIALDFAGITGGVGRSTVEINQANVQSANVVQTDERSRVVLSLKRSASYALQMADRALLVTLEPAASAPPSEPAQNRVVAQRRTEAPLGAIDFRRAGEGTGRVRLALPSSKVTADIKQVGSNLVVELSNVSLPERLRRRLDVNDFGTPVQTVTTTEVGDRVRMVIAPQGEWEHTAYQTESELVIEIKPLKIDPRKLTQGAGYNGQKLSLNFQSIDVRQVLQVIADFTGFNVVTSDSVTGTVTLRLQDVPWDQALDIILQSKGLGVRKNGSVLWIAPKEEIATKEKLEFESKLSSENLEPLRTQSFQLNYAKAADIAPQLTAGGGSSAPAAPGASGSAAGTSSARILSPRGSAIAEVRTNQLFVTDIPSKLEQVAQLIAKVDIAVRQIVIEARIVEADDSFGKSLGVKLGGADVRASKGGDGGYDVGGDNRVAFGTSYSNAVGASGFGGTNDVTSNFVNLPAIGQNGYNPASFAVTLFSAASNRMMGLEISAIESDGKGKVVSSPRVITADQAKAVIEQGVEIPYQIATSSGATSIAFRKATLRLDVTPQITPDGNVNLDLEVNKDSLGVTTPGGIAINTKRVKTQVLVENGGTVVIGGIFTQEEQEDQTKVPLLGDLPFVGVLFKSTTRSSKKKEMLVFITPKLVSERAMVR
ncbi:MAG: type IV pilus secretin PilQ [Betaproteobacteria bacterium]